MPWPPDGLTLSGVVSLRDGEEASSRVLFLDEPAEGGSLTARLAWVASDLPFGPLSLAIRLEGGRGEKAERIRLDPPRDLVNLAIRTYDDRAWRRHLSLLEGTLDGDERSRLKDLPAEQRDDAWQAVWEAVARQTGQPPRLLMTRHLARIVEADRRYGIYGRGALSDRGRAYVRYGEPDRIEQYGDDLSRESRWEIWYYYERQLQLTFLDPHGLGDYHLYSRSPL